MIELNHIGDVRLVASPGNLREGTIMHDKFGKLLDLEIAPSWRNPRPLETAQLALATMKPHKPRSVADSSDGPANGAGAYKVCADEIVIRNRGSRDDEEVSEIILHELAHASGHPRRLARFAVPPDAIDVDPPVDEQGNSSHSGHEHEELVAGLGGFLVATRLGLRCVYGLAPIHWLTHMSKIERLADIETAIREAKRAAVFILGKEL